MEELKRRPLWLADGRGGMRAIHGWADYTKRTIKLELAAGESVLAVPDTVKYMPTELFIASDDKLAAAVVGQEILYWALAPGPVASQTLSGQAKTQKVIALPGGQWFALARDLPSVPGKFGVRLEDCFHMTAQGPKWFSQPSRSLEQPV